MDDIMHTHQCHIRDLAEGGGGGGQKFLMGAVRGLALQPLMSFS